MRRSKTALVLINFAKQRLGQIHYIAHCDAEIMYTSQQTIKAVKSTYKLNVYSIMRNGIMLNDARGLADE